MYITINKIRYSCTGYSPRGDVVIFNGIEGLELPVCGTVTLCADDGFELAVQDSEIYARQVYEDEVLTLTNLPEPIPEPERTIDIARAEKLSGLNGSCSGAIYLGVNIGDLRYNFSEKTQINLETIARLINEGQQAFLYRADNENEQRIYDANEMKVIIIAKAEWVSINTLYYEMLKKWINRELVIETIDGIHYGVRLPNDLMYELSTKLESIGVDLSKYADMFV